MRSRLRSDRFDEFHSCRFRLFGVFAVFFIRDFQFHSALAKDAAVLERLSFEHEHTFDKFITLRDLRSVKRIVHRLSLFYDLIVKARYLIPIFPASFGETVMLHFCLTSVPKSRRSSDVDCLNPIHRRRFAEFIVKPVLPSFALIKFSEFLRGQALSSYPML